MIFTICIHTLIICAQIVDKETTQYCKENRDFDKCMTGCSCGWCYGAETNWTGSCEYHDFQCSGNWTLSADVGLCAKDGNTYKIIVFYVLLPTIIIFCCFSLGVLTRHFIRNRRNIPYHVVIN